MELKNKTALVKGATDGLGRLLAINLAKGGCILIIHGRDESKLDKLQAELIRENEEISISKVVCDFNKPVLKKSNFAQILNVSSIAGVEIPQDYFHTIYSATKFGV